MQLINERTISQRQVNAGKPLNWFEIDTELIYRLNPMQDEKEGINLWRVHTYPTVNIEGEYPELATNDEKSKRPKHYVVEVLLNGKHYNAEHLLNYDDSDKTPSMERTLVAMDRHFSLVRIIRDFGPHGLDKYFLYTEKI